MTDARRKAMKRQRARGNDPVGTRSTPEVREDHNPWMYHTGLVHKEWLEKRKSDEYVEVL